MKKEMAIPMIRHFRLSSPQKSLKSDGSVMTHQTAQQFSDRIKNGNPKFPPKSNLLYLIRADDDSIWTFDVQKALDERKCALTKNNFPDWKQSEYMRHEDGYRDS